ncbi:MAG TPA: MAPEG family protein [Polyangiaceae bacterium]|nr:MAPEG family protein [Polyangiaceae bacterium]
MTDVHLLLVASFITWASLMLAAVLRSRSWTPEGQKLAFGNREAMPEPSALAGRAQRASLNNLENLVLFVAAFVAARLSGAAPDAVLPGAHLFAWGRLAYVAVYIAGVPYLRTVVWLASVAGTFWVALAAL